MTAMTRTPVTVDEMVNGDLIAVAEWPDPDAEYFVGVSPVNPDRFAMVNEYGSLSYGTASAKWQRLTKPATLCKHCGEGIYLPRWTIVWHHVSKTPGQSGFTSCATYATPAEVTA